MVADSVPEAEREAAPVRVGSVERDAEGLGDSEDCKLDTLAVPVAREETVPVRDAPPLRVTLGDVDTVSVGVAVAVGEPLPEAVGDARGRGAGQGDGGRGGGGGGARGGGHGRLCEEVAERRGELEAEEDAVVDHESATDTEGGPESDREPKVALRAALPVPRAPTEEEPVAVKEGSEEAVYEAEEQQAVSVEKRGAVVDTVEAVLAMAVRSGVLEAVAQEEGVAELCGEADTVAVPLTVAQVEAVLETARVSRA
jgi:hypothetical protein